MKINRFALLLLLTTGGLLAAMSVSSSHHATSAPTMAHTCQQATETPDPRHGDTAEASGQHTASNLRLLERLEAAVDTFARLVMVL